MEETDPVGAGGATGTEPSVPGSKVLLRTGDLTLRQCGAIKEVPRYLTQGKY